MCSVKEVFTSTGEKFGKSTSTFKPTGMTQQVLTDASPEVIQAWAEQAVQRLLTNNSLRGHE
eukprot:4896025-Amphidinium_carterae.2